MEKRILIVLAGQLRTWFDVAPTVQRMIDAHTGAGHLVDVLMMFPTQSRTYDCGNGVVYNYTGVSLADTLTACVVHEREYDETLIRDFYQRNTGSDDFYWLTGRDPEIYPAYLPLINYWYYRTRVSVEKSKLEIDGDFLYDTVLLSRFDHGFIWNNPDIIVPNLPPGLVLDRRQVDINERFANTQVETRYFPDGKQCGSLTAFRNDMIEQMSSCTTDLYNGGFLNTIDPMNDPRTFGALTHHQFPNRFGSYGILTYEDYQRHPNSLISQSTNESMVRGWSSGINYIALRAAGEVTYERVHDVLGRLGVYDLDRTDASKFIFRKIVLGAENASEIVKRLGVKVIPKHPMKDLNELGRSMFDPDEGKYLDFKPIALVDLDRDDLSEFVDRHGCFENPFRKTIVSELFKTD